MFEALIQQMSVLWQVPAEWIRAVMMAESSGDPDNYNPGDPSYGLMGMMLKTARGLGYSGSAEGLFDPETNLYLGSKLLAQLRDRYGDDLRRVYSAYNSGNPDLWQTSAQVAANVDRVFSFLTAAAGAAASSPALLVLVALAALWWRSSVRR